MLTSLSYLLISLLAPLAGWFFSSLCTPDTNYFKHVGGLDLNLDHSASGEPHTIFQGSSIFLIGEIYMNRWTFSSWANRQLLRAAGGRNSMGGGGREG